MDKLVLLIDGGKKFADEATWLLSAVSTRYVCVRLTKQGRERVGRLTRDVSGATKIAAVLREITTPVTSSREPLWEQIRREAAKAHRKHHATLLFCISDLSELEYVKVVARLPHMEIWNKTSDAVARFIQIEQANPDAEKQANSGDFVLDQVADIETLGDDLRDDNTGRLDAKKVSGLFDVSVPSIAKAAGVTRQTLDANPDSEMVQPFLRLFERVARLRSHPQFTDDAALRKWFRRPLALFSGHSAEDLFKVGKLEVVAEKVDQLLTGDFGG